MSNEQKVLINHESIVQMYEKIQEYEGGTYKDRELVAWLTGMLKVMSEMAEKFPK